MQETQNRGEDWKCWHDPLDDCPNDEVETSVIESGQPFTFDDEILWTSTDMAFIDTCFVHVTMINDIRHTPMIDDPLPIR